jgi:hypothetical protein
VKLTTYLHLVPRSRICGAIPPLPQYAFIAWYLVKHKDNFSLPYNDPLGAGIAQWYSAGLQAGSPGVRVPAGAETFPLHHCIETSAGSHPASPQMGTRCSFRRVKRPGLEADQSPPSSAEVKNAWNYTSIRTTRLHGVVLI